MKISVIVPIYGVEKYLQRCIDSLLKQTYTDYELILVDDGSPDSCPIICDEYAKRDKRIKVIHKENGGLSDARNTGMQEATGEYIVFVDSDDWVCDDYLEKLLQAISDTEADICECEVIYAYGDEQKPMQISKALDIYSAEQSLKLLMEDRVFHQYVWNKIYRREVIGDILFPKGKTNEDEFWTYQIFGKAKKIIKIQAALYFYFQRPDSIMGSAYSIKRLDALEAKALRMDYLEKMFPQLLNDAKLNLFGSCIYAGQMSLCHLSESELEKAVTKINDILTKSEVTFWDCIFANGHNKVWFTMARISFWMTCRIKNYLKKI